MSLFIDRVGSAPISWGICEVPGWGAQLPVDRVLGEMAGLGLRATELGSIGYLPTDPAELHDLLERHGLRLTAGFNALALADPDCADDAIARATAGADRLVAAGAERFVTCAVSDPDDWRRPELDAAAWRLLFDQLAQIDDICAERGLVQAFHPHVDSLVETAPEIERVLDATSVRFVLETGHMLIGGLDPHAFALEHAERVALVHLKDVRLDLIEPLNRDELTLMEAVQAGIFPPLGDGGAPIADTIRALEAGGYDGWYIVEQDVALVDGLPPEGDGPVRQVERSLTYLAAVADTIDASHAFEHNNKGEQPE